MAGQKRKSPDHPPKARGYKGKRKVEDLPDCEVATNFSSPETGNIYTCVAEIVGEEPQTVYERVRNYLPAGSPLDFRQHLEVLRTSRAAFPEAETLRLIHLAFDMYLLAIPQRRELRRLYGREGEPYDYDLVLVQDKRSLAWNIGKDSNWIT
jgi:hypothetical protein